MTAVGHYLGVGWPVHRRGIDRLDCISRKIDLNDHLQGRFTTPQGNRRGALGTLSFSEPNPKVRGRRAPDGMI
jgi:hypothetical protein